MNHRRLSTFCLGLGLTTLACGSSPPSAPRTGNTPEDPEPSMETMPRPDAAARQDSMAPPVTSQPDAATTAPPDVAPPDTAPPDAVAVDGPGGPAPSRPVGPYTCSLVIGISATGDWFKAGFEQIVDNDRWQLMAVHSAFINYWADPKHAIWGSKPTSACKVNANNPDRVILTVLSNHWETWTVEQWTAPIIAAMKNFKAKYSNLRNLELATFVRSPGDKPCPLGDTFRQYDLAPADEAFQKVAAMYPELVTVAPKVHVDSCADYNNHPPHLQLAGPASRAAMKMGAIYKD